MKKIIAQRYANEWIPSGYTYVEFNVPDGEADYWTKRIEMLGYKAATDITDKPHVNYFPVKVPPDMLTVQCINRFYPDQDVTKIVEWATLLDSIATLSQSPHHFEYWYRTSSMEWLKRCLVCKGDYDMLDNGYLPEHKIYIHKEWCPAIRGTGL